MQLVNFYIHHLPATVGGCFFIILKSTHLPLNSYPYPPSYNVKPLNLPICYPCLTLTKKIRGGQWWKMMELLLCLLFDFYCIDAYLLNKASKKIDGSLGFCCPVKRYDESIGLCCPFCYFVSCKQLELAHCNLLSEFHTFSML